MRDYSDFLDQKSQVGEASGFDPVWKPDFLFDFQAALVDWAIRMGRCAIFADCGLGKTPMQLVWAENVVRKTNKPVLVLAPLAVSHQTMREGEKFGVECKRVARGSDCTSCIVYITNYQKLHKFDSCFFGGIVCDESSILKNFDGKTKAAVTEFSRQIKYRLLCTATAAPNDHEELGTSSECLGFLGYQDMITRFFKQDVVKDYLGWGRTRYVFRGHSEEPFWKWVCSWARACRRPSDLGFDDGRFVLPPLNEIEHLIKTSTPREGMLFSTPAKTLPEQREERRITIDERCDKAADIANSHDGQTVIWCHLNDEAAALVDRIDGAKQVSGSMSDDQKEERLLGFQSGEIETLVTKPRIGCFGLNWQNCNNVITFPSHSWEQYYQAVRRCWRFGQDRPVSVHIITTEGEAGVMANLRRKAASADDMFASLVRNMNDSQVLSRDVTFLEREEVPQWL